LVHKSKEKKFIPWEAFSRQVGGQEKGFRGMYKGNVNTKRFVGGWKIGVGKGFRGDVPPSRHNAGKKGGDGFKAKASCVLFCCY